MQRAKKNYLIYAVMLLLFGALIYMAIEEGDRFFTPCGSIVNCRRRHSFHYVLSVCHRQLASSLEYIADTDHCCPADGKAFRLSVQAHRAARVIGEIVAVLCWGLLC